MSLKDEIDKLWNESTEGLQNVIEQAIELLKKSLKQKEDIPLEIGLDILITANTTTGFGTEYNHAKLLLDVYQILLKSKNASTIPKVYRFTCLIYGVIYTLLSVDETISDKKVPGLMKPFGLEENATKIQIIRTLLHSSYTLFEDSKPDHWKLELISFIITGLCLIEEFDTLNERDLSIEEMISKITKESENESEMMVLNKWNARWLEASDYFRLTSVLLFEKHPKNEDTWMNKVKRLTNDS